MYIKQNHQIKLVARCFFFKIKFKFHDSETHTHTVHSTEIYIFTHKLCNGVSDYDIIDVRKKAHTIKRKTENKHKNLCFNITVVKGKKRRKKRKRILKFHNKSSCHI